MLKSMRLKQVVLVLSSEAVATFLVGARRCRQQGGEKSLLYCCFVDNVEISAGYSNVNIEVCALFVAVEVEVPDCESRFAWSSTLVYIALARAN